MADNEFVRSETNQALINNDVGGLDQYKMNRLKAKKQRSLEQRLNDIERRLAVLEKERN